MKKPKVRVTVRRMMMAIALIGLAFILVRGRGSPAPSTRRATVEVRFKQIRVGMTSQQVEALVGPPLTKVPTWPDPSYVNWMYTDSRSGSSNYWMRDVLMQNDKVVRVYSMYWID